MRIQTCAAIILSIALCGYANAQRVDPASKIKTVVPGYNLLCDAVQTAIWGVTDERWERTRMRPGNINCSFLITTAFCSNPSCSKNAAIVLLPPVSIDNPNADRIVGKFNAGYAYKLSDIVDEFPNVERITFSWHKLMTTVSVSTDDPAYLKQLVVGIKRGFRAPK